MCPKVGINEQGKLDVGHIYPALNSMGKRLPLPAFLRKIPPPQQLAQLPLTPPEKPATYHFVNHFGSKTKLSRHVITSHDQNQVLVGLPTRDEFRESKEQDAVRDRNVSNINTVILHRHEFFDVYMNAFGFHLKEQLP